MFLLLLNQYVLLIFKQLADLGNHFPAAVRKFRQNLVWVGLELLRSELPGWRLSWLSRLLCWLSGLSGLLRLDADWDHWKRNRAGQQAKSSRFSQF